MRTKPREPRDGRGGTTNAPGTTRGHDEAVRTLRDRAQKGSHSPELVESFIQCLAQVDQPATPSPTTEDDPPATEKTETP